MGEYRPKQTRPGFSIFLKEKSFGIKRICGYLS
ncbi:unnamed protein product [Larinioides sclopetarius]|uniref:Ribosomal protein L16 n=1 Tax=Larinioides sclopetarius TaxID=280406 RepID=A0AAV2A9R7_9ARAC